MGRRNQATQTLAEAAGALEKALDAELDKRTQALKPYMEAKLKGIRCIMQCFMKYTESTGGKLPEHHMEAFKLLYGEIDSCCLTAELIAQKK